MKIGKPQITRQGDQIIWQVDVESAAGDATLWYRLHESFADLLSESSDAALVGLLIPAMAAGEDIHVEGTLSERLFHNLSQFQSVVQRVMPWLRRIAIHASDIHHEVVRAPGVATGFSAGIDSWCALADYHYAKGPSRYKISHLLFNNVGSHGGGGSRLFRERYTRLVPIADHLGLPLVVVDSNLDAFYWGRFRFQLTHTPRNTSVALLLQRGIGRYLYASSHDYAHIFVGPSDSIAHVDPITLPLLSTETLEAVSVGSEYSRVEKTLRVAEVPDSYSTLDICASNDNTSHFANCSTCWKCLRTLATLEIGGYLERYAPSFDLTAYRKQRTLFFAEMLGSEDVLLREIIPFSRTRGFEFPLASRVLNGVGYARIHRLWKLGRRKLGFGGKRRERPDSDPSDIGIGELRSAE